MYDEERAKLEGRISAIKAIVDGAPLGTAHLETEMKRKEYELKNAMERIETLRGQLDSTLAQRQEYYAHLANAGAFIEDVEVILAAPRRSLKQIRAALRDFLGFDL